METKEKQVGRKKRKAYFELMKKMMKCRYKQPKYIFLGEEVNGPSVILSNHEGTDAPMALEMYMDKPLRMWGAHEMNSGLIKMYKYQSRVYYHEKKHSFSKVILFDCKPANKFVLFWFRFNFNL